VSQQSNLRRRQAVHSLRAVTSYGLLDFPAADAPGADEQASRGTVHERPDGLQVRTEDALGAVVGVADVVADRSRLPADLTCPGHGGSP